ncbi:hypothetical protein [Corynebacterium riegelii]|uniref:hypothetical protein n=1 Tax=Corynebacterium riegelii TaxID=156976 RepID=UPI00288A9F66|nr:hypothetical protein [Corynebacterium riegelii]
MEEFKNLPNIQSYALTASRPEVLRIGGALYPMLPEGVSTLSITGHGTGFVVYLCTSSSASGRYVARIAQAGDTLVLSNVAVPRGEKRYFQIVSDSSGDVGVVVVTYPL